MLRFLHLVYELLFGFSAARHGETDGHGPTAIGHDPDGTGYGAAQYRPLVWNDIRSLTLWVAT